MEIFEYSFMIRAFIAGAAISVIAPLIGTYLVVRRYSLIADTLAHVSLLGVTVGFFAGIHPLGTAATISVISALIIENLRAERKLPGDAVLAIFISGSLAFAVILFNLMEGVGMNLFAFLFGSITTVSVLDLYLIIPFSLIISGAVFFLHKQLFLVSLDEELARASRVRTKMINYLLIIITALTVSLAIKVMGALLVGALIVIPVMTAINFRKGFYATKKIAVVVSVICVMGGLFLSYYAGLPSGGTIVAVLLLFFFFSFWR